MGKFYGNEYSRLGFQGVKDNGDQLCVCEGQPANYTEATTLKDSGGKLLGFVSMAAGDFTIAAGDTNGRKVTVAAKSGVPITNPLGGDADHVVVVDTGNSEMYLGTTITPAKTGLANGDSVNTPAFDDEWADPT